MTHERICKMQIREQKQTLCLALGADPNKIPPDNLKIVLHVLDALCRVDVDRDVHQSCEACGSPEVIDAKAEMSSVGCALMRM